MARTPHISDADLLHAARTVFVSRGVSATTAEIAACAGVSEGTLFKRFGTKHKLFEIAMCAETDVSGLVARVAFGAQDKPAETVLVELGSAIMAKFERIVPFVAMHMAGAMSQENVPVFAPGTPPPLRLIASVEGLFEALAAEGKLRRGPVDTMARMFVGALWQFVFLGYVMRRFVGIEAHPMTPDEFVKAQATLFYRGAAPDPAPPVRAASTPRARKHTRPPARKK